MERENFCQWPNGKRNNGGSPDKYPSWASSPVGGSPHNVFSTVSIYFLSGSTFYQLLLSMMLLVLLGAQSAEVACCLAVKLGACIFWVH